MESRLDEWELSFPRHVWEDLIYNSKKSIKMDVYHYEKLYPKCIMNEFGAIAMDEFRLILINEIKSRNNVQKIWRIHSDAFGILSDANNCDEFEMEFKGLKLKILKKTFEITQIK